MNSILTGMNYFNFLVDFVSKDGFRCSFGVMYDAEISHLFFMDGTLIFCELDVGNLEHLRCILLLLEATLVLRVNFSKSVLIHIGEAPGLQCLARFFA